MSVGIPTRFYCAFESVEKTVGNINKILYNDMSLKKCQKRTTEQYFVKILKCSKITFLLYSYALYTYIMLCV